MTSIPGLFYDGVTSRQHEVTLSLWDDKLQVTGDNIDQSYPRAAIQWSAPFKQAPGTVQFPDGALCEVTNTQVIEGQAIETWLSKTQDYPFERILRHWEQRLGYAFVALLLTLLSLWGGMQYGVPWVAKQVAFALPSSASTALGQHSLMLMDKTYFDPTQLKAKRQRQLQRLFSDMTRSQPDPNQYRLVLRYCKELGANAFALPDGTVILTDALVELAQQDQELIAILAHEIGHIEYRHSLRMLLQNSVMTLALTAVTGDVSSLLAASAVLIGSQYSRAFEQQADSFALDYMLEHDIALQHFADILLRLDTDHALDDTLPDFLSTHPATTERIQRFTTRERL